MVLLTVEGNTVGLVMRVHRVAIDNTLNDFVIILTASRIMRLTVNNATGMNIIFCQNFVIKKRVLA